MTIFESEESLRQVQLAATRVEERKMEQARRRDAARFKREENTKLVAESKKKEKEVGDNDNGDHNLSNDDSKNAFLVRDIDGNLVDPDAEGWSEPVQLDCCCVCHENNPPNTITDCEWCKTCNINLALKKLAMVKK